MAITKKYLTVDGVKLAYEEYGHGEAVLFLLRIPTFILWGAKDNIVPLKLGQRLHSEIPSSTMVILDDCGHIPQEEFSEETSEYLIEFLSKERHS